MKLEGWQRVRWREASNQRRRNSPSRNSFYPGRRVPCAVFFVHFNIFNFCRELFSSNLIFAPLIPILLGFLQAQSSGKSSSPFDLSPMAYRVSVGSSVAYFLAPAASFVFPGFASQFRVLMSVCGSLSVATLISMTLRLQWWSILFILLFMGVLFKLLHKLHATYGNIRHATYGNIRRRGPRWTRSVLPL